MNKTKLVAVVVAMSLGAAASYLPLRETLAWIRAHYWRQQLAVAADDGVQMIIRKIGQLDKAGIPILAQSLGSDRACVAWAAKQELWRLLENWRYFPAKECTSRLQILAEALAQEVDHFSPAGRSDAAELATRILVRPLEGRGVDSYKLLTATEKVLRSGADIKGKSIRPHADAPLPLAQLEKDHLPADSPILLSEGRETNGGPSARLRPLPEADAQANQPSLLDHTTAGDTSSIVTRLPQVSRIPDHDEASVESSTTAKQDRQSASADRIRPTSFVGPEENERRLSVMLAAKDALDLLQELNDNNETKATQAEAELIRRGFTAAQLAVVGRLFDPNPAIRKELVRQLPNLEDINTVPWLLRLARDQDVEVRLAAITVLATSSDPAVLDQLEAIIQSDSDSTVRRIADRIVLQRKSLR